LTRAIGAASTVPIPRVLRRPVLGALARRFGCDLSEADRPLEDFADFQSFFTRGLRAGARVFDEATVVSPSDGEVTSRGAVEQGRLLQVKGVDYRVEDLVGGAREAAAFEGGEQITIYLHPRNYHRVHAPVAGAVVSSCHLPGELFPVHEGAARSIPGLFARNERLVTTIAAAGFAAAVVMVAAMGCGHVRAAYDDAAWNRVGPHRYDPPLPVEQGAPIGTFAMGSTVVLLLGPGAPSLTEIDPGTPLRLGRALTHRTDSRAVARGAHG
jgi:phosphatidylserine decarboxylase